jgi:hypothetical protein
MWSYDTRGGRGIRRGRARDVLALGRYGTRRPTIALRVRSSEILRDALLATGIAQVRHGSDPRDLMI